jgi:uncharacterized protein
MIIDIHTHCHNYEILGEGVRFSNDEFIHELNHHGMDYAAVSNAFALETDFVAGNETVFELMEVYPDQIVGIVALHPAFPEESAATLKRALDLGVRAIKLHCELSHVKYCDSRHMALVETVADLGLPIQIHTGTRHIEDAIGLASAFPQATFLFAHTGGMAYKLMLEQMQKLDNTIADLSGNVFLQDFVKDCVNALGDERVAFGSDFVFMDPCIMIRMIETSPIGDQSKERVLGGNAMRLLGIGEK